MNLMIPRRLGDDNVSAGLERGRGGDGEVGYGGGGSWRALGCEHGRARFKKRHDARLVPVAAAATENTRSTLSLSPDTKATHSESKRARTRPAMTLSESAAAV